MPISKIKEYVELYEVGDSTFSKRKELMKQHKVEIQKKINEVKSENLYSLVIQTIIINIKTKIL